MGVLQDAAARKGSIRIAAARKVKNMCASWRMHTGAHKHAGIKEEAEEKLRQFLADWQQAPQPLPQAANEQRMAIDALHADLIHLQEEKNVFVFQVCSYTLMRTILHWLVLHACQHTMHTSERPLLVPQTS